jgi:molybdopterin synthase catalytic subunit
MARAVLTAVAEEATAELGGGAVAVEHRVGELAVGDVSVAIAVAAPHRESAYQASRYVIEEIKKRLPVWKREHYLDGDSRWVTGKEPAA